MPDRITLNLTADVAAVTSGLSEVADGLEETESKLEDVGKASEDALGWFKQGMKESSEAIKDTKGDYQDLMDAERDRRRELQRANDEAIAAHRKEADALDDVKEKAEDAGNTVSTDLGGALKDTAADGEEGISGIADEILGLAGIAGGVGGVVSTALGGAIVLVTSSIQEQQAQAQKLRDDLVGAYRAAIEEGRSFLDQSQIISSALDIQLDPTRYAEVKKAAELAGVDINTALLAQAGSIDDLQILVEGLKQKYEEAGGSTAALTTADQELGIQLGLIDQTIKKYEGLIAVHEEGAAAAENRATLEAQLSEAEQARIQQTNDASQKRWEAETARYDAAASKPPIVFQTDLESPDIDGLIANLQGRARSQRVTVKVVGVDSSGREIL